MGKVYILGHKGFIGKHVAELIPQDQVVFISRENFQKIISKDLNYAFTSDDVLINLAWDYLDNFRSTDHMLCLEEHKRFYNSVFDMGLRNVCAIGTCLEYGIKEGELSEEMVSDPQLPYAIVKDDLRKYFEKMSHEIGLKYNWLRLFYIYGEGQSERTVYGQLVKAAHEAREVFDMSPGLQKRDYLHVKAAARIIFRVATRSPGAGVVNCCSGRPVTMIEFVNQRLAELKCEMKLNLGKYTYPNYEGLEFWGNINKLNKVLGDTNE